MRRLLLIGATVLMAGLSPGCTRGRTPARPGEEASRSALRPTTAGEGHGKGDLADPAATAANTEPPPLVRCFPGDTALDAVRPLSTLLEHAAERFDHGDYRVALACAEEAARLEPRSVEAHHDRAAALLELGRKEEAQAAFTRALALDPDDPETLAGAADLYINHLPVSNDHTETGLEYARRGARRLKRGRDRELAGRLGLLAGQALNDLGRSREALTALDAALPMAPDDLRIRYERGVAFFEMCQFEEARRSFAEVIERNPSDAWAHHQLGLVLERLGDGAGSERELARARSLAPGEFAAPVLLPPEDFRSLVDKEASRLPAALRNDLGMVHLETADLPDTTDLTAEQPPLSPTILGLFRGTPLGDPQDASELRTIILYRKNLGRAVTSREELVAQVRTTLLHELGHLHGEDDEELRARGLE
ncbi:MAG TPA: tetratricopeptide repeat protein [Polyangia bacterium]|nr:tetratricopeptide repeat protein [Polyangia bacterium]